jgi:chemotaxis protein methyltransferase CheR
MPLLSQQPRRCDPVDLAMEITAKQFKQFSDLIYQECGINLHEGKQQLLKARLAKRLRATGIHSVHTYLTQLKNNSTERVSFIDAISTNHTFFFREKHHFDYLQDSHQKIWCAASSSGEEPYSIAIHCMEQGFKPSIHATDISTDVLHKGQQGIFPMERARTMPQVLLKKYFKKGQGQWHGFIKVRNEIRNMVIFQRYNLVTDAVPANQYDIIFCRNVLIYFDNQTKATVVNKLHQALKTDGFLVIGGAESLNNIEHGYRYVRPSIYAKKGI